MSMLDDDEWDDLCTEAKRAVNKVFCKYLHPITTHQDRVTFGLETISLVTAEYIWNLVLPDHPEVRADLREALGLRVKNILDEMQDRYKKEKMQ